MPDLLRDRPHTSLDPSVSRAPAARMTNVRWLVVAVLFVVTTVNYADRATIALAGPEIADELRLGGDGPPTWIMRRPR